MKYSVEINFGIKITLKIDQNNKKQEKTYIECPCHVNSFSFWVLHSLLWFLVIAPFVRFFLVLR